MIGTLLEKLLVSVGVDLSGFNDELNKASADVDKFAKDAKRDFAKIGQSWQATGKKMIKTGAVMTAGVTAPLALFGKQATQAAIDAEEMQSAFDVVFGDMADSTRQWAEETGNAMGRATTEMQRGALAFQELFGKALDPKKASEMSREFAVLTQDLASFKNLSNEVAQQKLFAGLTGEAEPLKAIGVFINESAVKTRALEMGLGDVNGKLTEQEKILSRASLIREQLAQADGDVLRTSDSTANRIKASEAAFEELSITVGTTLIPALTPLIEIVSSLLEGFNQLDPGMQTFLIFAGGAVAVLGPLITVIGGLVTGIGALIPVFSSIGPILGALGGAFKGLLLSPLGLVVLAVGAVVAAFVYWDDIVAIAEKVGKAISDWYTENIKPTMDKVIAAIQPVVDFFRDYFAVQIGNVIKLVSALISGDFAGAWDAAKSIVSTAVQALLQVISTIAPMAGAYFSDLASRIIDTLSDLAKRMISFGRNIIEGLIKGIKAAPQAVFNALKSVVFAGVDGIKSYLGIASPSKLFKGFGLNMAQGLAIGIEQGKSGVIKSIEGLNQDIAAASTFDPLLTPMASPSGAGAGQFQNTEIAAVEASSNLQIVTNDINNFTDGLVDVGRRLGDEITNGLTDVLAGRQSFKDTIKGLFSNFLEDVINSAVSSLQGGQSQGGGLGSLFAGALSSLFGGGGARAVGGPVLPGRAYDVGLGEKFIPSMPGRVLSRNDAMRAAGGGTGVPLNLTVKVEGARGNQEIMTMVREGVQQGIGQYDQVVGDRVDQSFKRRG